MRLAILCPGQGSQEVATLVSLGNEPRARPVIKAFERATGITIDALRSLSAATIRSNVIAQPLVCATGLAAYSVLREMLPEAVVYAGYSVGELTAYGCAGWFSFEETIRLSVERARVMDEVTVSSAAMAAVRGLKRADIEAALVGCDVHVAIVNGCDRFVVAGAAADMPTVSARVAERGGGSTQLDVQVASHTPLLDEAVERFRAVLERSELRHGIPVLAGIDGTPVLTRTRAVETLSRQLAEPVLWKNCVHGIAEAGVTIAVELPPGADLTKLVRGVDPSITARARAE